MKHRLSVRAVLPGVAACVALAAGCDRAVTGVAGPPAVEVTLARDTLGVGDSVPVVGTARTGGGRVLMVPADRLTVSDPAVARLNGQWLVGRRAGRVIVRAEYGGRLGEALAVVR